jgi:hypothetical protein
MSKKPLAVVIKGNPKYLYNRKTALLAAAFYSEIEHLLKTLGWEVEFDQGAPFTTPRDDAQCWIAHSRGIDRLRFAPDHIQTLALSTKCTITGHIDTVGMDHNHYRLSAEDIKNIRALRRN